MQPIIPLNPASYERHAIHGQGRCWAETNCYVDVVVELVHALGFEPRAALAFTLSIDFEADQWTFFKFRNADLLDMFGMNIQELNPWRELAGHVAAQVQMGRPVLVEMDSYYLPDTAGTAYKVAHVKSTIAVNEIDIETRHLGYFHGQGYYHLSGDDFVDIFQLHGLVHDRMLPPYIELVRLESNPAEAAPALLVKSVESLRREVRRLPRVNPFQTFKRQFESDLGWLMGESIETFHLYSFANLRQYGACFELAETYLSWLAENGEPRLDEAIGAYHEISALAKAFQFKLARSMARQKPLDLTPIDTMAGFWQKGADVLIQHYGA